MPVPEWGLRVVMVVRQRQRGLGRDAGAAQRREEALRIADAGRGGHARPAGERRQRTGRAALDLARVAGFQPHPGLARPRRRSSFRRAGHADIGHHRVHFAQPAGRFAQQPAGSRRPLPIPRSSCTTISTSRASAGVAGRRPRRSRPRRDARAAAPGQPARAGCTETGAPLARAIRAGSSPNADAASAAPCPTRGSGPIFAP